MYGIDYFDYKDVQIETVRKILNIVSKDNDINSPGVWHPEGITTFQPILCTCLHSVSCVGPETQSFAHRTS